MKRIASSPIRELDSSGEDFSNVNDVERFIERVNSSETIRTLILNDIKTTDETLSMLCDGIRNDNLKKLDLRTDLSGLIDDERTEMIVHNCPRLESLNLSHNAIGNRGATILSKMTQLRTLISTNNFIKNVDDIATKLSNLTTLDLSDNSIDDDGVKKIATMTGLKSLNLANNYFRFEGVMQIACNLKNLTTLDLSGGMYRFGNYGAIAVTKLPNLTTLRLSFDRIGDVGAIAISSMEGLVTLDLSHNRIRNAGAVALSSMKNLRTLNLFDNDVEHEGATALASMEGLESLNLRWSAKYDEDGNLLTKICDEERKRKRVA